MRNRLLGMSVVMFLVVTGCAGESGSAATTSTSSVAGVPSTVTATEPSPPTTTVSVLINDFWEPVGGSEYLDSIHGSSIERRGVAEEDASVAFVDFREAIDERIVEGRLDLGAIDRLWVNALLMLEDRMDVGLVKEQMARLEEARAERLADLPAILTDSQEVLTAALIERDQASRIEAYKMLSDLVNRDRPLRNADSNLVQSLIEAFTDVRPAMLRDEVLASGQIGAELDPDDLPALPARVLLVQWSDGFQWAEVVVLVGLDGIPLGYLDNHSVVDSQAMSIEDGRVVYGVSAAPKYAETIDDCEVSWSDADRTYLICSDTTSYDTVERWAEIRVRHADGTTERLGGAGYEYPEEHRGATGAVAGLWRYVIPSPDGDAVLGQWSGECESPSAHMIYRGDVSTGMGNVDDAWPESRALGWRDDGMALVTITAGACSFAYDASGVYIVAPGGQLEPLYITTTGGVTAWLVDTTSSG